MEVELEPRVKPLAFKVKAISRESPTQKAAHVLDSDLRNHWSTGTNTKEWILLELDEPCLLSHVRIYNKSVLEWEVSVGLRYKPETFQKVRPRCEAPRRDIVYAMNYSPCRYVRISCLRGNPIALFFVQLLGISVPGLEPEFLPVVNSLVPHIMSHKQEGHDIHLQLLQDLTSRLVTFLPQLEADLSGFSESPEHTLLFFAMLTGPFYPILHIVNERLVKEAVKIAGSLPDSESSKNSHLAVGFTISSNFEPRKQRSALSPSSSVMVFRPDVIFTLLRMAYKDPNLGKVCRMVSRILLRLTETVEREFGSLTSNITHDKESKVDYSVLYGEEFLTPDVHWDTNYLNILDIGLVEEGLLHILYACASQPVLCSKLADNVSDFWLALPFVQALLPALRPYIGSDQIDDSFSQWKQPSIQHALSQIVSTSSSSVYRSLLQACAGYLASFSTSHAKAASVLIDLCFGVLAPWIAQVVAKVDLAVELVEDLFGEIQGSRFAFAHARAALKYIVLALSGKMDDIMAKFKDAKHQILFMVEMLEPFLDPAMTPVKSVISFGNVSSTFLEKQELNCEIALNVIRTAVNRLPVLPSLEAEWRRGSVATSVLLSILDPQMQLPLDIDLQKSSAGEGQEPQPSYHSVTQNGESLPKLTSQEDTDGRTNNIDVSGKIDICEESSFLFAPSELSRISLTSVPMIIEEKTLDSTCGKMWQDDLEKQYLDLGIPKNTLVTDFFNLQADYLHLMNYRDAELKASEFRRFAHDLHSQSSLTPEAHNTAIDALLLGAECLVNPYFLMPFRGASQEVNKEYASRSFTVSDVRRVLEKKDNELKIIQDLERKRDKAVLDLLLEAAELDRQFQETDSGAELSVSCMEAGEEVVKLSNGDTLSADAITLVRQNQMLLCKFLVQKLQKGHHSMHDILIQSILFLLHSATKLYCSPEDIVDIILSSADRFSELLKSVYFQSKEGNLHLSSSKLHEIQRGWMLLQRLIVASSGFDVESNIHVNSLNVFQFANLVPPSAWLRKISAFSSSASPLVRYLGWMAVSRNAKQYLKERLFLASDLSELTSLLSVFSDELAQIGNCGDLKDESKIKESRINEERNNVQHFTSSSQQNVNQSFHALYPEISQFFPNLKKEFKAFGESVLEAVGLQLRSLSPGVLPDLMCWFSDLCSWPFSGKEKEKDQLYSQKNPDHLKGFVAKNAKAVILFVLESILSAHVEAIVPELPRMLQVFTSLCNSCYSDVAFLNSVLNLLKPIISHSLRKVSKVENLLSDSCHNFESLCFGALLDDLRHNNYDIGHSKENVHSKPLTIFVLASVFSDLSFDCKIKIIRSSLDWADFTQSVLDTSSHDFLHAYQTLMESCRKFLVGALTVFGIIPLKTFLYSVSGIGETYLASTELCSGFLVSILSSAAELPSSVESRDDGGVQMNENILQLKISDILKFTEEVECLIQKVSPSVDQCYRIHHKLANKLAFNLSECFVYTKFLSLSAQKVLMQPGSEMEATFPASSIQWSADEWNISLQEYASFILNLEENHCWEVASLMLSCLLRVPGCFHLDSMIDKICLAMKKFSCCSPHIEWRLQTDKWIPLIFTRAIQLQANSEIHLVDFFSFLLKHPEPEQRFIALKHLRKLMVDICGEEAALTSMPTNSDVVLSTTLPISAALVSSTWDQVACLVSSDTSQLLRTHALVLLLNYVPFAGRQKLQSFLEASDVLLRSLANLKESTCECPMEKLSLTLIGNICLHAPAEDVYLIPETVWKKIDSIGMLGKEACPVSQDRRTCEALCRLRDEGDEAKQMLREVLNSKTPHQLDPDFASTRESILQVMANFTSVQSYFDFFGKESDRKGLEFEEAEIEMELLHEEISSSELYDSVDLLELPFFDASAKDDKRLQQIKDAIRSLEKTKLKEEIRARQQQKLLLRRARQNYLEEAALQEAELLRELDREKNYEVEREIERQRILELERAKTRELQHNLEMEREKHVQRELQRELEQVESGARPSRRDFSSSTHNSRPRYRERDNGRPGSEGNLRGISSGGLPETGSPQASVPKVVLSGGRPFSGQVPTILQSQDRSDETGSAYEENFDGSRDSGDTGSVGDPDMVSALEGQSGFGAALRNAPRGGKSRQSMERRERDARREGKWERKHG